MMNTFVVLLLFFVLAMVFSMFITEAAAGNGGFHIELVHRESHLSPYYNHSESTSDRFQKSALRSLARVNQFGVSSTTLDTNIESQVIPDPADGEYLMKLSIGTPPIEILAIVDTGSDLIWTQCKPCNICHKQDLPVYDPEISSTYRGLSCDSSPCQSLNKSATCEMKACRYTYNYADGSQINGTLATEMFTFDSMDTNVQNVSIPRLVFGCGNENTNNFSSRVSGLVGLGGGPLSLVSQLGTKFDGKFSYCLVSILEVNSTSKLKFGSQAKISGKNVVSTPLVSKNPIAYYYLTLEAISVGGKRLENKPMNNSKPTAGNIIIDSGSTFTMLPPELYNQVETAMKEAIPVSAIQESRANFKLCYSAQPKLQIPDMIFHFTGADVSLPAFNTFVEVSPGVVCLTMIPANNNGVPIFGNLAQMNFLVEYDLVGRKVSFAPADCSTAPNSCFPKKCLLLLLSLFAYCLLCMKVN